MLHQIKFCFFFFLVFFLLLPCSSQNVAEVGITGYVTNMDGTPVKNATVLIKNANMTATTNDTGKYLITGILSVKHQFGIIRNGSNAIIKSDGLYFYVNNENEKVEIDLFSLNGKLSESVYNGLANKGYYKISLFSKPKSSQTYILRLKIGDNVSLFKIPYSSKVNSITQTSNILNVVSQKNGFLLAKKLAVADSLIVTANGYLRNSRLITSYTGSHYIVLKTNADQTKKTVNFDGIFEQGTTDNDPQVTFCTAVWVQDANKNYFNTMYVSNWLSHEGYKYSLVNVCPDWKGPDSTRWANIISSNPSFVDAVTKATPVTGHVTFDFNPEKFGLQQAMSYYFCIEVHVEGKYNVLFADSMNLGNNDQIKTPSITYIPQQHPFASVDALHDVKISYK